MERSWNLPLELSSTVKVEQHLQFDREPTSRSQADTSAGRQWT